MHFILTMLMVVLSNWLTRNPNNTKIVNGKSHLVGTGEAIVKMLKEYSMVKDTLETYTNWDKVPTNLKTKTSLKEMGLRPNGVPVAYKYWEHGRRSGTWDLYDVADTTPLPPKRIRLKKELQGELKESELGYYLYQLNKHAKNLRTLEAREQNYDLKDAVIAKYIEDTGKSSEKHYATYTRNFGQLRLYDVFDFIQIGEYGFHFNPTYRLSKPPEDATCISNGQQFISKRIVIECNMMKARKYLNAYVDGKLTLVMGFAEEQSSIA